MAEPLDIDRLKQWIGRVAEAADVAAPGPVAGLAATLDWDETEFRPGDPLPPGAHWLYFLPQVPASELDQDGHGLRGDFLPPVPLPRRMWAGGRLEFLSPLRIGDEMTRRSEIIGVTEKQGKGGPMVFVRVRHLVDAGGRTAIREDHDIVYRQAPKNVPGPGAPQPRPRPAPGEGTWRRTIDPDPVMLFRYSALTFNGHRIHYDHPYATEVEGYPGLVVHGPLTATLLMDLCRRQNPKARLSRFDYRAVGPLFDTAPFIIAGQPAGDGVSARVWAANREGELAMEGTASFEPRD